MKKLALGVLSLFSLIDVATASTPDTLRVMLNSPLGPDHAPIVIADKQGFFKEAGLKIQLITPTTNVNVAKHITKDQADLGIGYEPQLIEEIDKGTPIIRVGTLIDKPLNCLVVLNKKGSLSLSDLKGRTISSSHDPLADAMLKSMLAKQGVTNIKMLDSPKDLTQALLSKKIGAASGLSRNMQVSLLEERGLKFTTFFPEEHGVPTYSELVFVAKTSQVKDPRIPRFMDAIKKAVAYMDEHPQESWSIFATSYPQLNNNATRIAWFNTMPYFAEDPAGFDGKEWETFAKYLHKNKLISKVEPASRYAVTLR